MGASKSPYRQKVLCTNSTPLKPTYDGTSTACIRIQRRYFADFLKQIENAFCEIYLAHSFFSRHASASVQPHHPYDCMACLFPLAAIDLRSFLQFLFLKTAKSLCAPHSMERFADARTHILSSELPANTSQPVF